MFLALGIAYDATKRRCDLVFQGGALVIDRTPATPLLLAIGTDRRAEPDDELPDGETEATLAAGFNTRRGWAGDRLATDGRRIGCRLWLLERAKLGDDTLLDAEAYAAEVTADWPERYGVEVEIAASRPDTNAMLLRVQAGDQVLSVRKAGA